LASDAVIGHIDGNLGLDPAIVEAWQVAVDHDIPRVLLVSNCVSGRADFDEVVAIAHRVLGDDFLTRYLPLADDAGEHMAGLFDVLRGVVITSHQTIPGDPEHLHHTADGRSALVDALAHVGLSEDILRNHQEGLPVSTVALAKAWLDDEVVGAIPTDNALASQFIVEWLVARKPRWMPIMELDGQTLDVCESTITVGLGVADGIGRIWGEANELVEADSNDQRKYLAENHVVIDERIALGTVVSEPHHSLRIVAPGF
jgi:hypothetical protein